LAIEPELPTISIVSRIIEIEEALRNLPLSEAKEIARWLQEYLKDRSVPQGAPNRAVVNLPDYARQRKEIFGDHVLPNLVLSARDEERW
jgi:hypothetical protein